MKNLLLRKGAMVLAVSIALSSAVLGTSAFAETNKKVDKDNLKIERLYGEVKEINLDKVQNIDKDELDKLIESGEFDFTQGNLISNSTAIEISVDDMFDSYVSEGKITQEEANKLKEVEKAVEKLYNELDLSACNGDEKKINEVFKKLEEKEKLLRSSVEDIMQKVGMSFGGKIECVFSESDEMKNITDEDSIPFKDFEEILNGFTSVTIK